MAEANSIVCRLLRNVRPSMQAVGVLPSAGHRKTYFRPPNPADLAAFMGRNTHFSGEYAGKLLPPGSNFSDFLESADWGRAVIERVFVRPGDFAAVWRAVPRGTRLSLPILSFRICHLAALHFPRLPENCS